MATLRFLGHACVLLEDGTHTIIVDPFLTGNPAATAQAADLHPQYILVTHAHGDHLGDAQSLARDNDATIITTNEIADQARRDGVKSHGLHIGGKMPFPFGTVRVTPALHGSGISGGMAAGFVVGFAGKNIYHAGDTALFGDMRLLGELEPIDVALLPIGNNFTMGADDAVRAVQMLACRYVVPIHYNTWPIIAADPQAFAAAVERQTTSRCLVVKPGGTVDLDRLEVTAAR